MPVIMDLLLGKGLRLEPPFAHPLQSPQESFMRGRPSLQPGAKAPDFTLADTDGVTHTLSRLVESGPVVLAFFPRAFTPG